MECIDLGNEFFLIRFSIAEDRARVLKAGPWFVGGHYLSIRCWEPNFRAETAKLSVAAVWIRLSGLPIEYYESSVLKDIGLAIRPVLRIDTQIVMEVRGCFARLCIQVNFDKLIIKLIKIGGLRQPMQYEGINALCFSCGHVGHKTEGCLNVMKPPKHAEKPVGENDAGGSHGVGKDHVAPDCDDFGPWVFVTRNGKPRKNLSKVEKSLTQEDISVSKPSQPTNFSSPTKETMWSNLGANMEFQHHCDLTKESNLRADRTNLSLSSEMPTFKQKS